MDMPKFFVMNQGEFNWLMIPALIWRPMPPLKTLAAYGGWGNALMRVA